MRRLTCDDIPAVRAIDTLAFPPEDQYDAAFYERIVSSHEHDALVATMADGTIAAWILANLATQPLRIQSLSVHPSFRKRGFGRSLVTEILRRHPTEIDLLVEPGNFEALRLYHKLGFAQTSADPELPQRIRMIRRPLGADAPIMRTR